MDKQWTEMEREKAGVHRADADFQTLPKISTKKK